ncbi:PepSY-associated TM helix domain-containing protein [Xenophilus arseniciresistens]|uniref:PepSY-associated TM helix domain-containing protein n=1 Tax=Xenophilus arseniciresistens TaxID=1283306 RepID=A0AAE3N7G6_9BURK|nr:PepSY-associated TM helix domain-containing protein [Xenophilus arseniciresistens]MDA7417420.1 PepSY-associated TM helix domain-containing protein [Xenophilus arseniciresistens]
MSAASVKPAPQAGAKKAPKAPGLRQTMSDLHIWTGLLMGWFLYAMFLTGTVSYFKEELSQWMQPELAHQAKVPELAGVAQRVVDTLAVQAPGSPQWSVGLPDERTNVASAFWRNPGVQGRRSFESARFDPATGEKVAARETAGGDFFYRFHFQFHYMPVLWGRWLAGIAAMFMLVAIVSGVITHKKIFIDFFTFRWGKGQRSWLDAHNALSVFGLPFHLMITYSGLITLMLMYMPWGNDAAFKTPAERRELTSQMSAFVQAEKPSGQKAALLPVGPFVREGEARWGVGNVSRITVNNPGDANARVVIARGEEGRASYSPQYLLFNGTTGALIEAKDKVGGAAETRGVLYALHLGRFADDAVRWMYFLVSLAGTAMVGTGLVMWTVKRRAKLPDPQKPYFGFWLVERLNIAAIAGLSVGMAAMLWANRLLPLELAQRREWEIHAMFIAWGATLLWAFVRPAKKAWIELLWAGALVLALLPVLNIFTTDRPLWSSLMDGDWVFAGLELTLLALAALHAMLAVRTARHKPKARPVRKAAAASAAAAPRPAAPPTAEGRLPGVEAQPALREAAP